MKKNSETQASFEDNVNRHIKNLIAFSKSSKIVLLLVISFFILLIILSVGKKSNIASGVNADDVEKKLAGIITQINGVEKAEVMITYASTSKKVPATSQAQGSINPLESNNSSAEKLFQSSSGQALIITELEPEVRGVAVVARGADDYMVRLNVINAVTTVLNISADKVEVLNMK